MRNINIVDIMLIIAYTRIHDSCWPYQIAIDYDFTIGLCDGNSNKTDHLMQEY